jgi:uncharacterized membrane protein (DUF4010 family)
MNLYFAGRFRRYLARPCGRADLLVYQALNPRWVWWMVVLITGISFVGYFAIKYVGNRLGTLVTSITGGLASSTAVTLSMAQFARDQNATSIFMAGVMAASSIMFIRVFIEVAIVNPALLSELWLPLIAMFLSVVGGGCWLWMRSSTGVPRMVSIRTSEA